MISYTLALCLAIPCLYAEDIRAFLTKSNAMADEDCIVKRDLQLPLWTVIKVDDYKKYYVVTSLKANWYTAGRICRFFRMQLASIRSEQEQNKLVDDLKRIEGERNYWTSGNDLAKYKLFVWADDTSFNYTYWSSDEPNGKTIDGEVEHCVQLTHNYQYYKWDDLRCSRVLNFICERIIKH